MSSQNVIARWQFFQGISKTPSWGDCIADLFLEYERIENDSVKHVISFKELSRQCLRCSEVSL